MKSQSIEELQATIARVKVSYETEISDLQKIVQGLEDKVNLLSSTSKAFTSDVIALTS